jgi:hypothetical protein
LRRRISNEFKLSACKHASFNHSTTSLGLLTICWCK